MPQADLRHALFARLALLAALILLPGSSAPASAFAAPGDGDTAASRDTGMARARGRATVQIVDPVRLHLAKDRMVLDRDRHHSTSRENDGSTIVHLQ